ncbi:MAG: hypothetical protein ABSH41_09475 [Syntrophobacteraceae bacterium]|jgi:hypothetical protein
MSFELLHFRDSDQILKKKGMMDDVMKTLEYLDTVLYEAPNKGELLKEALKDMGWREDGTLNIMEGRRYQHRGFKNRIAVEGYIGTFENLEGIFRLQVAFDKQKIDTGILLINSLRSFDSPFGSSRDLVEWEIEQLEPTIFMPLSVALFDLGKPDSEPVLKESIPR